MFNNTLQLATVSLGPRLDVALIDGPTNQRTVRRVVVGGVTYDFTIGHAPSNENPGFDTTRSLIRLSMSQRDTETGKDYTAYAQLILSIPKDKVDADDTNNLVANLISFLFAGDVAVYDVLASPYLSGGDLGTKLSTVVHRLYAGEP